MEALKEWFMAITGVLILSVVGEGILPSGTVKKYATMLFGLLLTITICSPFIRGADFNFDVGELQQTAVIQVENMEKKESETVLRLYKANIAKKMNTDLKSINENCDYEFMLEVESQNMEKFGEIRGVIVTVRTTEVNLCIDGQIEEVISSKYGIDRKNIAVKYISV